MKKIIVFLFFMCSILNGMAQNKAALSKKAKKDFEGSWIGALGKDTILITLLQTHWNMEDKPSPVDSIVHLYGWHKIVDNGTTIEDDLDSMSQNLEKGFSIIVGYTLNKDNFSITLRDITRHRVLNGSIYFLNPDEIRITTQLTEALRYDNKKYPEGQSYPKEFTLKRVPTNLISGFQR